MKKRKMLQRIMSVVLTIVLALSAGTEARAYTATASGYILEIGESMTITNDDMTNGTGYVKTWSISNSSVAGISGNGRNCRVDAKSAGKAKITVKTYSWVTNYLYNPVTHKMEERTTDQTTYHYYDIEVREEERDPEPTGIALSDTSLVMDVQSQRKLTYTLTPAGVSAQVTFISSNSSVARVDSASGLVTAVSAGTAVITASTPQGLRATCTVTVQEDHTPTGITLSAASLNLQGIGAESQLTYTLTPSGAVADVTFMSSNKSVATVGRTSGLITAVGSGTATITASTTQGLRATCTVTVTVEAEPDDPVQHSDFTYNVLDNGTLEITGYNGTATDITLPAVIDGKQVTRIDLWAFSSGDLISVNLPESISYINPQAFMGNNITDINVSYRNKTYSSYDSCLYTKDGSQLLRCPSGKSSVALWDGVRKIGGAAFYGCSRLKSVSLPDSVMTVGSYAFFACISLESIKIPGSLSCIKDHTFYNCSGLRKVELPDSVLHVENNVFRDCSSLRDVYYTGSSSQWEEINIDSGNESLINATLHCANPGIKPTNPNPSPVETTPGKGTALKYGGDTYVVTKVKSEVAFKKPSGSKTSITIPNTVKIDGITYKVTSISNSAFKDNKKLKKVIIGDNVKTIKSWAFYDCKSLKSIAIPKGVTEIEGCAFYNCKSLKSITIPKGVMEIEDYTFWGCWSLKSVTIPKGVTKIGENAFYDCRSLEGISIPKGVTKIENGTFDGCDSLKRISIPKGVTKIGENAFCSCQSIERITIPKEVTKIGEGAFKYCRSLKRITIPKGITKIEGWTFEYCESLERITIPKGVTEIGAVAFGACSKLENITIPKGVTKIGRDAFGGCERLKCITIPKGITKINEYTFSECGSLKSIIIPTSVKEIEDGAFMDCKSLKSITIPKNVKKIGERAFLDCSKLKTITIKSTKLTRVGKKAFKGINSKAKIKVPSGKLGAYRRLLKGKM